MCEEAGRNSEPSGSISAPIPERVEWADYYKAIVMVLVVVGHATGKFNPYIYQFHMAAFFFISGYLDHSEHTSFLGVAVRKFFSLWLPLLTLVFLFACFEHLLAQTGQYSLIYGGDFPGMWERLRIYIVTGNCGTQSLGASWFIITLLGVTLLFKPLSLLGRGQHFFVLLPISFLLLFLGYRMIAAGNTVSAGIFRADLVFVGIFYYTLGFWAKHTGFFLGFSNSLRAVLLLINVFFFYYFGNVYITLVDWPSRTFNTPLEDALASFNGITFVWSLALLASYLPPLCRKLLCHIGQNTLGILAFHFLMIKFCLIALYHASVIPDEAVAGVVPPTEIGNAYWLPITVFSIVGSLGMWKLLKAIPVLNFMLGQKKDYTRAILKKISQ